MSRTDRLEAEIERAHEALDDGDVEAAQAALARAERIDRKHPDVLMIGAIIAEETGDGDGALNRLEQIIAVAPEEPMPRLLAARVLLELKEDPKAALAMIEPAFDEIDDEELLIDAVVTKTSALLGLGDPASRKLARATLAELATDALDDADTLMLLAGLAMDLEDGDLALRFANHIEVGDDLGLASDKQHLLGELHGARGDKEAQTKHWLEARMLDLRAPVDPDHPGFVPPHPEVTVAAEELIDALPAKIRQHLDNVPILLDEVPSEDLVRDGVDPRSLGLFSGPPMSEPDAPPAPTVIHLFVRNIGRICSDAEEFFAELEVTIWHETAHYFGLEDDELEAMGLG